ncbi:MAG: hypothetical protein IJZ93_05670 [Clostridia bacterium]|nr:hypothetical protein [Clostridia bacterium]
MGLRAFPVRGGLIRENCDFGIEKTQKLYYNLSKNKIFIAEKDVFRPRNPGKRGRKIGNLVLEGVGKRGRKIMCNTFKTETRLCGGKRSSQHKKRDDYGVARVKKRDRF